MSVPSSDEVEVATDTLRTKAGTWRTQSGAMANAGAAAAPLTFHGLEGGLFTPFTSVYNDVVADVVARCSEGEAEMIMIADTLGQVADTYDEEDLRGEHRMRNLY